MNSWHPKHWQPEETVCMVMIFVLLCHDFYFLGDDFNVNCEYCRFVSTCYSKMHVLNSWVITCFILLQNACACVHFVLFAFTVLVVEWNLWRHVTCPEFTVKHNSTIFPLKSSAISCSVRCWCEGTKALMALIFSLRSYMGRWPEWR
jgi:hypothetical protein